MNFLEKDLENIISETKSIDLSERGLHISGKRFRQLHVGNYGIADLVTFERAYYDYVPSKVTVYELKKDIISIDTLLQACRYANGIRNYLSQHRQYFWHDKDFDIHITLIGKNIDKSNGFTNLISVIPNISVYTYSYHFDGIKFEKSYDFYLINDGF